MNELVSTMEEVVADAQSVDSQAIELSLDQLDSVAGGPNVFSMD